MPQFDHDDTSQIEASLVALEEVIVQLAGKCDHLLEVLRGEPLLPPSVEDIVTQRAVLVGLLEAVSDLKWSVMEQQADEDIRQGRTKRFGSIQELIADLDS